MRFFPDEESSLFDEINCRVIPLQRGIYLVAFSAVKT